MGNFQKNLGRNAAQFSSINKTITLILKQKLQILRSIQRLNGIPPSLEDLFFGMNSESGIRGQYTSLK